MPTCNNHVMPNHIVFSSPDVVRLIYLHLEAGRGLKMKSLFAGNSIVKLRFDSILFVSHDRSVTLTNSVNAIKDIIATLPRYYSRAIDENSYIFRQYISYQVYRA